MKVKNQILTAPAVAMALMLVLGGVCWYGISAVFSSFTDIATTRYSRFAFATKQTEDVGAVHYGAYRYFAWVGKIEQAKLDETSKALNTSVLEIEKRIAAEVDNPNYTPAERALITKARDELSKYKKSVSNALDMGSIDPTTGAAMMQSADQQFSVLREAMKEWVANQSTLVDEGYQRAKVQYERSGILIVCLFILALVATGVIGYLVGRRVVNSIYTAMKLASSIERGNLQTSVSISGDDELSLLLKSLTRMQENLRSIVSGIRTKAVSLDGSTAELDDLTRNLLNGSHNQSNDAESAAAAVEEMAVSISLVSDSASLAHQLTDVTFRVSNDGLAKVESATAEIRVIEESFGSFSKLISGLHKQTDEITSIINLIGDIAKQTDLLALNAAIEAARAGEQGRGFAVVADEVRQLSERTAKATREINTTIKSIQTMTGSASSAMQEVDGQVKRGVMIISELIPSLTELRDSAKNAAGNLSDLTSTIKEQQLAGDQIALNSEKIARMAESNGAAVNRCSSATQNIAQLSKDLAVSVSVFSI